MNNNTFSNLGFSCVMNKYPVSVKGYSKRRGNKSYRKSHQHQPMIITSVVDKQPFYNIRIGHLNPMPNLELRHPRCASTKEV